jgi:type III secretory pathway lipoprotein EscJ
VLIKYMVGVDGKAPVAVDDVQGFVANAVPELKKENVKVLMTEAKFVTEVSEEPRLQQVMGMRIDKASVGTFKTIIGLFALLFIAMAGVTAFMVVRRPAARPPPRAKTQEG